MESPSYMSLLFMYGKYIVKAITKENKKLRAKPNDDTM